MPRVFMYVVDRDFGFAPNPFHGTCTLATCKPPIRKGAAVGDWVVGMGGRRLKATGNCIYAMQVSATLTYNEYWAHPEFRDKRPVRNGSRVMMLGDNIYNRPEGQAEWQQIDSHHSLEDGSPNPLNVKADTKTNRVLVSRHFFYFGKAAPKVPTELLKKIGFKNGIGYRVFDAVRCTDLLSWIASHSEAMNAILANPYDFAESAKRYTGKGSVVV